MTARLTLPERVVALDHALVDVAHAFGGAIALAYYAEPRATVDIDLNVFVAELQADRVLEPLRGLGVATEADAAQEVAAAGQIRLWWETTPVDLFFRYDPFHDAAEAAVRRVPFADTTIPILSAEHLVVCKVVYDRARDWVDIDAMRDAATELDVAEIIRWVQRIVGDEDPRYERIVARLSR